jgi:hypothetical protein
MMPLMFYMLLFCGLYGKRGIMSVFSGKDGEMYKKYWKAVQGL